MQFQKNSLSSRSRQREETALQSRHKYLSVFYDDSGSANAGGKSGISHRVQLYQEPPDGIIPLQDFARLAMERMRILKVVEAVGVKANKAAGDYRSLMQDELRKLPFPVCQSLFRAHGRFDEEAARWDVISHYVLLLAHCRSEELRQWLLKQELALFRFRFLQESPESRTAFLQVNKLHYTAVDMRQIDGSMLEALASCLHKPPASLETLRDHIFYEVDYVEALELVRNRKCVLMKGKAYLHEDDVVHLVLTKFRTNMSRSLALSARSLPELEEDERILPLLRNLHKSYVGDGSRKSTAVEGAVTLENIDSVAEQSFPLCMLTLHQTLRQEHKLKHWGRLQYGLFLKGVGLSVDDAMRFWRDEFTKFPGIDGEKFEKTYAYNFRHMYGKEGKRISYSPYSCPKIILTNQPAAGDCHGCPYKHWDRGLLKQKLLSLKLHWAEVDEILDFVKGGHYQMACGRYFDAKHKANADDVTGINHPNSYFKDSRRLLDGTGLSTPVDG